MRMRTPFVLCLLATIPAPLVAQKVDVDTMPGAEPARHDHRHHDDDDENGLRLGVSIASHYNRVEGLPVMIGPVVRAGDANRLELSGQVIWRTEPSATLEDETGYRAR